MTQRIRLGMSVAACLLVVACARGPVASPASPSTTEPSPRALVAALLGPWQREPLPLTPELITATDDACRTDPDFPGGVELVLIDARGTGKLLAHYAGPAAEAECDDALIAADGTITGSLSMSGPIDQLVIAPRQVAVRTTGCCNGDGPPWQTVTGRAGADIARVVLDVEGVGRVTASLGSGSFVAWWPIDGPVRPPGGPGPVPMTAFTVTGYDILGQPVATAPGG